MVNRDYRHTPGPQREKEASINRKGSEDDREARKYQYMVSHGFRPIEGKPIEMIKRCIKWNISKQITFFFSYTNRNIGD